MAKPRYRHAHQQERKRWEPTVAAGDAYCVEPVCLYRSRWIPPGSAWNLSHDPSGTVWIGPSHEKCNLSEAAKRGNRMRSRRNRALVKRKPKPSLWW